MNMDPTSLPHHWINRLSFLIRKDLQARFRKIGHAVTAEEWAVLLFLWQEDNRTPGELARLSVRDPTTMTRLLDAMEKKRLVERRIDPEDRRRMRVRLSPRGAEIRPALIAKAQELITKSVANIDPDDLQATLKTLTRMYENLDRKDPKDG